jgi:hypothetical protein
VSKLAGECLNLNDETGGKAGLTPASRLRPKARQSGKGELLTPIADNLTRRTQQGRDHVIGESFICWETILVKWRGAVGGTAVTVPVETTLIATTILELLGVPCDPYRGHATPLLTQVYRSESRTSMGHLPVTPTASGVRLTLRYGKVEHNED